MKTNKIIYWIATGLLSALLLMSSSMYIFKHEEITQAFANLGYPTYLVYPLAILKISAVIVLITQKNNVIKQWAYAGLLFDFVLAFFAHLMIDDGEHVPALAAAILLLTSFIFNNKLNPQITIK